MAGRFLAPALSIVLCGAWLPAPAAEQLTLDRVFAAVPQWGAAPGRIVWAPDGRSFLYALPTQDLLITHGTSDDNVHMANTIEMLQAFIEADKTNVDFSVRAAISTNICGIGGPSTYDRRA